MARKTVTTIVDDVDGSDITGQAVRVEITMEGQTYGLDLSEDNANTLREMYLANAEVIDDEPEAYDPYEVRQWAKANNLAIAERGKIPHHVLNAYFARRH